MKRMFALKGRSRVERRILAEADAAPLRSIGLSGKAYGSIGT